MACLTCNRNYSGPGHLCPDCMAGLRAALAAITRNHAALTTELHDHAGASRPPGAAGQPDTDGIPDPLALAANGAPGGVIPTRHGNRDHAADQWNTDPPSVLAVLTSWEDDWRHRTSAPAAPTISVARAAAYLADHLTWAARNLGPGPGGITDFADEIHTLDHLLRAALRDTPATQHGVPCLDCGHILTRRYTNPATCDHPVRAHGPYLIRTTPTPLIIGRIRRDPHCDHSHDDPRHWDCHGSNTCPCDQGGRTDDWVCSNRDCHRSYTPEQYNLAVWEHWYRQRPIPFLYVLPLDRR